MVNPEARTCAVASFLRQVGYEVAAATDAFQGLELVGEFAPHLVLTSLRLAGLDGLTLMDKIHAARPEARVVVITAHGSVDVAVDAIQRGAADFLEKPIDLQALQRKVRDLLSQRHFQDRAFPAPGSVERVAASLAIVAGHPSIRAVLHRAERVAGTRATVLLSGESGTGKGLFASAIHQMSGRQGRFVDLSCAALTESLLEAELFGHERGAFTGAKSRREGRFMHADGGTLYLDEIAETSPATQVKLLRFLQDRRFERVGGNATLEVDVRLVAATNRDLEAEVAAGRFREDLYYRLQVFCIHLPPLRERRSDIPALAALFLARFGGEHGRPAESFSRQTMERLQAYRWPGNVRELAHAVEHAVIMAQESSIKPEALPRSLIDPHQDPLDVTIPGSSLADIERAAILMTTMAVSGRVSEAAAMLGISRSKIYYRLREYGMFPQPAADR